MIQGDPKYTGIAVGEFTVNFLGTQPRMDAKAAFVDPKTGATHGWTNANVWSPSTVAKLHELREAMEQDLARQHFSGAVDEPSAPAAGPAGPVGISGGLGEHLGSDGDQV